MDIFYYVSMVVGAVAVLTACYVWFTKQQGGTFGLTMLAVGFVLVALPVSRNIIVNIGNVKIEVQRLMGNVNTLNANIQNIQQANQLLTADVEKVIDNQSASREALNKLAVTVQQKTSATPFEMSDFTRTLRSVQPLTTNNVRNADRILREIKPID